MHCLLTLAPQCSIFPESYSRVDVFPVSDAGSGDEWIDIADLQSDTNTEPVSNDNNNAGNDIHDNSESEAEGYETDSEDNDIHSESRATASED